LENFQHTHAFKVRGALNKVFNLTEPERGRGVIAASSVNHALGVAYSSAMIGLELTVVMPRLASEIKINLAKKYGARVILHGNTYDDAYIHARDIASEFGKILMPSFDDLKIITGQSMIAMEVLDDLQYVNLFLVPIGGGGLVLGTLIALSLLDYNATTVGVVAVCAASMLESIRAGRKVNLSHIETIADGIAVQELGSLNYDIINRLSVRSSQSKMRNF